MRFLAALALLAILIATVGCTSQSDERTVETAAPTTVPPDPCLSIDATIGDAGYVIVTEPAAGEAVGSPFMARGCSRSYESTVTWVLTDAKGVTLGSGFAMGGGFEGGGPFEFEVTFDVSAPQVIHLDVSDPGGSDEGGPAPRTVLPLIAGS